ncbi:MAG: hypothetical protein AB1715_10035 [Acidobacteriota bacterium]
MTDERSATRAFELLSRVQAGQAITTRDDQNEFPAFLDAAKLCRRSRGRFRLIDTGKLSLSELEWLGESGADLYTSDEARPRKVELELMAKACSRGNATTVYFHHGTLTADGGAGPETMAFLQEIGRSGVDLHLSNRERSRRLSDLAGLACTCRKAGSVFVYYHHGRPPVDLEPLAGSGGWIHLSDRGLEHEEDAALVAVLTRQATQSDAGCVVHIEKGLELAAARTLWQAGAHLLFKTPPADYRSAYRALEKQARKKKLSFRSYYLFTISLP